jgi:hypothetical protein
MQSERLPKSLRSLQAQEQELAQILSSSLTQISEQAGQQLEVGKIKTDGQLHDYLSKQVGLKISDKSVCKNHCSPFEALADAFFARSVVAVWKASRGFGGKTVMLAGLTYAELNDLGANIALLGGSGEQAARSYEYHTGDQPNLPDTFWQHPAAKKELLVGEITQKNTRLSNGGRIRIQMASTKSVRGGHPQRLRIDEVDEVQVALIDAALGQPMAARGIPAQTVLSSTHHYANGAMTEFLSRARLNDWPIFEWCWRENLEANGGWLPQAEVDAKRKTVSNQMWENEYDLQEPAPDSRAIDQDAVERMFDKELGEFKGELGEYIEIEPPMEVCTSEECAVEHEGVPRDYPVGSTPDGLCLVCKSDLKPAEYSHSADWAKKKDYTVIITWRRDVKPMRWVAFERSGRKPWPIMVAKFDERQKRYGSVYAVHDGTGVGDVVGDYLTTAAEGFIMVGRERANLLSEYIAAIERDEIRAPHIVWAHNEHKMASVEDVYKSSTAHHLPDSMAAGALGYRACNYTHGIFI